ncbi:hypothetical protein HPB50_016389 [Hyalomma asiaticum]|uniref:Uncharacterized protein n=1 Tax=Hyalomma asiaticum TaxID=266040 RepID=A0ACB7SW45_HYAAI|nr:hypothetical protein HPB50_016389 [Hyalomma asiaticum]
MFVRARGPSSKKHNARFEHVLPGALANRYSRVTSVPFGATHRGQQRADADPLQSQLQQESRPFLRHANSPSSTDHTADCGDTRMPMQRNQLHARRQAGKRPRKARLSPSEISSCALRFYFGEALPPPPVPPPLLESATPNVRRPGSGWHRSLKGNVTRIRRE